MRRRLFAFLPVAAVFLFAGAVRAQDRAPTTAPSEPPPGVTRVACVGDSITYGSRLKNRSRDSYPVQLGRMLGDGWDVRNFGVSGVTMLKNGDKPYDKQKAYKQALAYKPDIVVIMLGTNDSKPQNWDQHKDEYVGDYKDLIEQFRKANANARIYCCLPVPAFPGGYGIREAIIGPEIVPMVRQVAEETHSSVIDLHSALQNSKEHFPDTVHPDPEGARQMAAAVYSAITGKSAPAGPATTEPAASGVGG